MSGAPMSGQGPYRLDSDSTHYFVVGPDGEMPGTRNVSALHPRLTKNRLNTAHHAALAQAARELERYMDDAASFGDELDADSLRDLTARWRGEPARQEGE